MPEGRLPHGQKPAAPSPASCRSLAASALRLWRSPCNERSEPRRGGAWSSFPFPAGKSSQCHLPRKNLSQLPLAHVRGPPEELDLSSALAALHGPGSGLEEKHQRCSQHCSPRVGDRGEPLSPLPWAGLIPVVGEGLELPLAWLCGDVGCGMNSASSHPHKLGDTEAPRASAHCSSFPVVLSQCGHQSNACIPKSQMGWEQDEPSLKETVTSYAGCSRLWQQRLLAFSPSTIPAQMFLD